MPIASPEIYQKMINKAREESFAFPAINVTSMMTANACMAAFQEENSDGIIQVSIGGGKFISGTAVGDSVEGAIALADYVSFMSKKYGVYFALHTDHCPPDHVEGFLKPLLVESERRKRLGQPSLFQSHMFDGSTLPLDENMKIAKELQDICDDLDIILEVEAGVVGGEEDGVNNEGVAAEKLYTTPEDVLYVYETMGKASLPFLFAAVFGNVHGVYKPGAVKLKPTILKEGLEAVLGKYGQTAELNYVFHGGSGSSIEEIHETITYGVIKMNIDTDMQYAVTRSVADHMLSNYDKVLKIDSGVGDKKFYDPRSYLKKAELAMKDRTIEAIQTLKASGKSLSV